MSLSVEEQELLNWHRGQLAQTARQDQLMLDTFNGDQTTRQIGISIPPQFSEFAGNLNYCRRVVELKADRQQVRRFTIPGEDGANEAMQTIMDMSNFGAQFSMFNQDRMVFGRGIMSIGANGPNGEPIIRAESPMQMHVAIDELTERTSSAARFVTRSQRPGQDGAEQIGVLYLPNVTITAKLGRHGWEQLDRNTHNLGEVPVVAFFNRRQTASTEGTSEFKDLIPVQEAANRTFLQMQLTLEAHGWPGKWVAVNAASKITEKKTKLEAYMDSFMLLNTSDVKVGQFQAASLENFATAFAEFDHKAAVISGLPARYLQKNPQNPATEGAIVADEINLVRDIESDNEQIGIVLGILGSLAYRIATGTQLLVPMKVEWFDPATPTMAQRADALAKQVAAGALSIEGFWDELGWSEARKARERAYLQAQRADDQYNLMAHFLPQLDNVQPVGPEAWTNDTSGGNAAI